jgi:phosphatidylinositol alpha-1,6-mannosyltransferase
MVGFRASRPDASRVVRLEADSASFHDGTKCLVRDVARELRAVTPVVMTTQTGLTSLPEGVAGHAVYAGSGAFAPALLENARAAVSLITGPRYDLWHFVFAPNPRTCTVARAVRKLRRTPIVQTVASPPRVFRQLASMLFGDEIVVQSRATRDSIEQVARLEGVRLPQVTVIPPPVSSLRRPSREAIRKAREELGVLPEQTLVLYPGDLEVSSGAAVSESLVEPLCARLSSTVVVFAYRNKTPKAAEQAASLKQRLAGKSVRITDRVGSMHALLCAADVVIFPVDDLWGKVDQPIVLLEALQLGTPCAVLARGPLKDVQGAVQIADLDVKSWLDVVMSLIGNGDARARVVGDGMAAAERVYASGVVARAYEDIYLRLLKRPRP